MGALKETKIDVELEGLAPIMFDRFIDHSADKRPPEQKLYLQGDNQVVLPAEHLNSFLTRQLPPVGCAMAFEARKGRTYRAIVQSHVVIEPYLIPFTKNGQPITFEGFKDDLERSPFWVFEGAAITKGGASVIKQPVKGRPVLNLPWGLAFEITLYESSDLSVAKLNDWFDKGGILIGLGSYRPRFGRFRVNRFEKQ